MKDVTLDRTTVLQLDADGTNGALDPAADCDVLRNDASLDLCAVADEKIRGAQLPFDSTEDLRWTVAFDVADDRHSGADARACRRIRRRPRPRRGLFNDRGLLLHGPPHGFDQICRRVLILLRCFALEHIHLPFFRWYSLRKGQSYLLAIERELTQCLLLPRAEDPQVRTPCENSTVPPFKEQTIASHSMYGAMSGI